MPVWTVCQTCQAIVGDLTQHMLWHATTEAQAAGS